MSNYSILTQNTLLGLSETAGCLYLDLLDVFQGHSSQEGERKAFWHAVRFDDECGEVFDYICRNSPAHDLGDKTLTKLAEFFAARWKHNFMGVA